MTQTSCTIPVITLQRIVPETNTRRQYVVSVGRDLFGTPVVLCRWGRIGQAGRMRTHACASIDAAEALAADVVARRRRRGYSSGNDAAGVQQPSKVRARRPTIGQVRRRAAAAAGRSTAQLCLFDAHTLLASWATKSAPQQARFVRPMVSPEMPQVGPRPDATSGARKLPSTSTSTSMPAAAAAAAAPGATSMATPLMRLLGKPATAHEREQWIEALATDPRMQGRLRRGRDFLRR